MAVCGSISRWGNYGGSRSVIATIKERWWWCQVASGKMAPEAAPSPLVPLESSPLSQVVTRCSHSAAPAHADHNHQLNSYCNILWNHQTNLSQNMSVRYRVKASSFYKSFNVPIIIAIHSWSFLSSLFTESVDRNDLANHFICLIFPWMLKLNYQLDDWCSLVKMQIANSRIVFQILFMEMIAKNVSYGFE